MVLDPLGLANRVIEVKQEEVEIKAAARNFVCVKVDKSVSKEEKARIVANAIKQFKMAKKRQKWHDYKE